MGSKKEHRKADSGSPTAGEPEYLIVGYLRRPHGVHGEMVMEIHTDFPDRLKPACRVYVGANHAAMTIAGSRVHNEGFIIKFDEIATPEEAGKFRNQLVYVTAADRPPLPKGMYYHHELIGFAIVDDANQVIGTLKEIIQTGANDVYVVNRGDGGELLLPVIPSVVLGVEFEQRRIHVRLIPGLLDETKD